MDSLTLEKIADLSVAGYEIYIIVALDSIGPASAESIKREIVRVHRSCGHNGFNRALNNLESDGIITNTEGMYTLVKENSDKKTSIETLAMTVSVLAQKLSMVTKQFQQYKETTSEQIESATKKIDDLKKVLKDSIDEKW